jgi:hypothetical protein
VFVPYYKLQQSAELWIQIRLSLTFMCELVYISVSLKVLGILFSFIIQNFECVRVNINVPIATTYINT